MRDIYSNFSYFQAIPPTLQDSANGDALTGETIDLKGYEAVTIAVTLGLVESMTTSTTSYFVLRLQHTDASALEAGPSDFADVADGDHIIHSVISVGATLTSGIWQASINGDDFGSATYCIGYKGPKRYVRVYMSGASAASINIAALAFIGYPTFWPVNTPA